MNEKLLQLVGECIAAANARSRAPDALFGADEVVADFEHADFFLRAAFHEGGTVTWFASLGGKHATFGATAEVSVSALTRQIQAEKARHQ